MKKLTAGFELRISSGVSTSELLKLEMVIKTDCVESSESMRGELVKKLFRWEGVRSEREMREF